MRIIKFRGKDAYGKYRYGDLWQRTDGTVIMDNYCWHRVHSDSVCQLIACDKNGCDVYEGDKIVRIADYDDDGKLIPVDNQPMNATFDDFGAICNGEIIAIQN